MGSGALRQDSKDKRGRPRGFTFSKTDYAVLEKIVDLGFQTYRQLREGVLKEFCRTSIWHRMKRMTREGLVNESRDDNGRILAWTITKKGAGFIYVNPDTARGQTRRARVYRSSFEHDAILVDIRDLLRQSPVINRWESEADLCVELMRRFNHLHPVDRREKIVAIPDAILHLEANGAEAKAALELELTQKARSRLVKKFEAHITNPGFHYVLYVTKDELLMRYLMDVYCQVQTNSPRVKISRERNGIYFTTLPNLLKDRLHTKFDGLRGSFCFAHLTA